jgi:hypothetical protein
MRNISEKICRENKKHTSSITFSQKSCCLGDNVEKYHTA